MTKRKNIIYFVAVFLLVVTSSFTPIMHRYYLSLTEVHINTDKHTLDVSSKLFTDDLELELGKIANKKIDLSTSTKNKEVELLLFNYIDKNFKINVGGKLQKLEYVGFEVENDAVWCYLEVKNYKGKGTISFLNTLLYESFSEQSNLVNVTLDGESKSGKLSNPEKLLEFTY
ncbi:hypothetical protein BH10BAC1_BH10BAC1_18130 [soil metagenome]